MVERLPGDVVVGEHFSGIDGVLGGIIFGIDLVVHHTLRHRG